MTHNDTHVKTLSYLTTDGAVYVDDPSLTQVFNALDIMDGQEIDTLSITLGNGDTLDVGGGNCDQYKCHARTKGNFYHLVNANIPRDMEDTMDIQMNEETNTFPICSIVSLQDVKTAIECFCLNGELSSAVSWNNTLEYDPL